MTHICVSKLTILGSDNGLSPGRRQAIIWTNAEILLIRPLGTNFNEILIGNQTFSFKKIHLKMLSAKWRPFCLGLNEINTRVHVWIKSKTKGWIQGISVLEIGRIDISKWNSASEWRKTNFGAEYVHAPWIEHRRLWKEARSSPQLLLAILST